MEREPYWDPTTAIPYNPIKFKIRDQVDLPEMSAVSLYAVLFVIVRVPCPFCSSSFLFHVRMIIP